MYLDKIPDSAVCNESAELARKYGHEGTVKFVNGVLRNISRNKDNINYPDKEKDFIKYLSVFYSHPEWMIKKLIKDYGREFTEELLKANNETPPLTIRTNRLRINKEELITKLLEEDIQVSEGSICKEALHIRGTSSLEDKESFKKGYYQVQDESSMLAGYALNPKAGDLILDICSAPGGKTTHFAELMNNDGKVIARDIHEHKLKLINDNAERLQINIIHTELFDANVFDEKLAQSCDKVLLDAPCSGLGVIRRKPDLRYKKQTDNFKELSELQLSMLNIAGKYVKKGGVLVYSTCTINKSENIEIVEKFLKENSDFYLDDLTNLVPDSVLSQTALKGYLELYPHVHNTDGFFIARMMRR